MTSGRDVMTFLAAVLRQPSVMGAVVRRPTVIELVLAYICRRPTGDA